jgi:PAS domain S-box-containing protein
MAEMRERVRKTGIDIIGNVPWGTHFCQFYESKEDLIDILVPYFMAGLKNNEFCMWITAESLHVDDAKRALKEKVDDLDDYFEKGQIEILDYRQWYTFSGHFDSDRVLEGWIEKERHALSKGFDGLRLTGNTFWLEKKDWESFNNYEAAVNSIVGKYRMLAVCTYSLDKYMVSEIIDVVSNHQFALVKRKDNWEIIESAEHRKTIETLRQSEARYRAIVESQTELIVRWLPGGVITFVNDAYCAYFGKSRQELIGHSFIPLIPDEDREKVQRHFDARNRENPLETHEQRVIAPNGKICWLEWTKRAIFDEHGNLGEFQSVGKDITERKLAEEGKDRLLKTIETVKEAICIVSPNRVIAYTNKAMDELFGYGNGELIGKDVSIINAGPEPEATAKQIKNAVEKEGEWEREVHSKRKDGTEFLTSARISIFRDKDGKILNYISTLHDITGRKQAENALRLHEIRLQALLDINKMTGASEQKILNFVREEIIKVAQSQFGFIGFMNEDESMLSMDNWSKETMAKCAVVDKPMHFTVVEAGLWGEPVRQRKPVVVNDYNAPHRIKKGFPAGHVPIERFLGIPVFDRDRIVAVAAVANKPNDYDESDIRAIESMMNDTWRLIRRKRAEKALIKSEASFRAIFDSANDAIFVHDTKSTKILNINEKACRMFGYTQEEFEKLTVEDISANIPSYERKNALRLIKKVIDEGPQLFEWKCKDKAGRIFWVEVNLKLTVIEDRKCILAIVRDITERKKAEGQFRASEERFRRSITDSPFPIMIHAEDGEVLQINKVWTDLTGYTHEEIPILSAWTERAYGQRKDVVIKHIDKLFDYDTKVEEGEYSIISKNGKTLIWDFSSAPLGKLPDGRRLVISMAMDVTKRKQAEEELNRQQYYLTKAQDIGVIGTWELDIKKNKLVWTDENYRIFGVPLGTELTYEIFMDCVHPDDRAYVGKKWSAALNNEPYDIEHRLIVDGKVKWVREKAELQFDDEGNCVYGIGFTQDITERKESEEERKNLLHDMGERIKELTCMYGVTKAIQQRDTLESTFQEVAKLIPPGWHYPEITCARVSFDGSQYLSDSFKETQWKQASDLIVDGRQRGSVEVYYLEEKPTLDEGPFLKEERKLIDAIALALSETIKRMSAEERTESLAKFPSENPFPVLRISQHGTILYSNDTGLPLLNKWERRIGESAPQDWCQMITDALDSNRNAIKEVKYGSYVVSFVLAPVAKAGYVNIYGRDVTKQKEAEYSLKKAHDDLEEKVRHRTSELSDVVSALRIEARERNFAQQELQQSEARLRDAQRIAHIGNWDWDIINDHLWWSDEVYRIFGVKPQEFNATNEAFISYVHPDNRDFVKLSVYEALYEYKPYSIDNRIVRPDSIERIVHEQAEVIYDSDNSPVRMKGTVQDVTAQKETEKKILDNQEQLRSLTTELLLSGERERRKIAVDLHDSIGQILAFSDRELGILQKSSPEKLMDSVREIRQYIRQAVEQTRTLTFDLSPPSLYDLGFEAAVEELIEQFSKERKIKCSFENGHCNEPLAVHIKILLYRSVRELLMNVARHSEAKNVRIASSRINNDLLVTVEDDGIGFDISRLKSKSGNSREFGLFSIRERLTHVDGRLDVQSDEGKGTRITLQVPLKIKY